MSRTVDFVYSVLIFFLILNKVSGSCSWSNEHCSRDSECCSKSCYRAFEGTNPRCRHSALSEKCIFSFHCADDLECGPKFNCCSPYWKMCTKTSDCCDPLHVCKPADGFYYNRCLYPNSAPTAIIPPRRKWHLLVLQPTIVFISVMFGTSHWRLQ